MEINKFFFQLLFLFTPGLIANLLVGALTSDKDKNPLMFIVTCFINGLIAYIIYYFIAIKFCLPFSFFVVVNGETIPNMFMEIIYVSAISIPCGLMESIAINYKIINKVGSFFKISNKTSDNSVWDFVTGLNPKKNDTQWVNIIDKENRILYFGFLQRYSLSSDDENEYFLRNVDAFRYSDDIIGDLLYTVPGIYLNGSRDKYIVEFPGLEEIEYEKKIDIIGDLYNLWIRIYKIVKESILLIYMRIMKAWNILFKEGE